jgi:phage terminase large subunit-like protein
LQRQALERKAKEIKLKRTLEASQIAFTRFFFKSRSEVFVPGGHHHLIDDALGKLERGELVDTAGKKTNNLLITLPPRFGKTQISVIDWMARSIARNPRAKFIHLSYSDELALDNSAKCRETVLSQAYQDFWPVKLKSDADSKKKWYTEQGGGVYATSAGGAVTGFGAGSLADLGDELRAQLSEEDAQLEAEIDDFFTDSITEPLDSSLFYGAIVIDDPIKVTDADNENARNLVNKRLNNTIKSRRNSRNTPLVIIMQRLHEDDMAGFVLAGGMEETFCHLNLKACDEEAKTSLWPAKHSFEELMKIKAADHAVFMAQYQQDPTPDEGTFFMANWFEGKRFRLGEEPTRLIKYGAGDYAVSADQGDWTEQAIAGFDIQENLYILDWSAARVTIDKSIDTMMQMFLDHDPMLWAGETGVIRRAMEPYILKEQQRRRTFFKLEWLPSTKSKAVNAKAFQGLCSAGKVYIPYGSWGDDLIAQLLKFTGRGDKVDDKVDVCGIFGRLLGSTLGPGTYHDTVDRPNNDYGIDDDDDDYGNGTIPI